MSQALSIRFQPPEQLSGPARELFALLRHSAGPGPVVERDEPTARLALPPSPAQDQLNARALRHRLRTLERERALKTVDGSATWIITERMTINPDLAERIGHSIVGSGLGTGRIVYGPPDLCLPAGVYMAVIEFRVTNMVDRRWAWVKGEVILNNRTFLSRQAKTLTGRGAYTFRLPFRVRESDLLRHAAPVIETRLNLRNVVGVEVTQVAIVSSSSGARSFVAHPVAHLRSAGNAALRRVGRGFARSRA